MKPSKKIKVLITAGPTKEPLDPVRFISNRSSGRLGTEIALASHNTGCSTKLLIGSGSNYNYQNLPFPTLPFETNNDLSNLLEKHSEWFDLLIMSAAVVDFIPIKKPEAKIIRDPDLNYSINLKPSPDLLAKISKNRKKNQYICGFALKEIPSLESDAVKKLKNKKIDAIVGNSLKSMEGSLIHDPFIYWQDESKSFISKKKSIEKKEFADWLVNELLNKFFPTTF